MPITQVIVNGNFNGGNTGWSGTDLETSYNESAYLGNGSTNRVAEIDGFANAVTVMQQSFTVTSSFSTSVTFRTALRTASLGNAGTEGYIVRVLDSASNVIASMTVLPTTTAWQTITMPFTFPGAGTYTVRFSEIGPNDSLGAIVDDVSLLVCFAAGTLIDTDLGLRRVERLARGDRVWTVDDGYQPIRWIAARRVTLAEQKADPALRPVCLRAGALGPGHPAQDLYLSQQHRVCISGWQAELHYGTPEVLVPALSLVNGHSVRIMPPMEDVTYVHFLLDGHHLVQSNGLMSETFFPNALSLKGLALRARAELARLFPNIAAAFPHTVRPTLRRREARLVA